VVPPEIAQKRISFWHCQNKNKTGFLAMTIGGFGYSKYFNSALKKNNTNL
jgi:hypothetical protein